MAAASEATVQYDRKNSIVQAKDFLCEPAEMASTSWTNDTVAVVTGGNKGIGYEIVKGLYSAGLTVVLTARDEGRGRAALKTLQADGFGAVHFHQLAVDSDDSVKKLADWLKENFGGIDVLVNNAGIGVMTTEVSYENAYEIMNTNYWGVLRVTDALLPLFKPNGLRRVVDVSSRAGVLERVRSETLRNEVAHVDTEEKLESLVQKFLQDAKAGAVDDWATRVNLYSASKLLLNARIRIVHKSLADKGIALNCVCPGAVKTDLNKMSPNANLTTAEGADTPVWLALLPTNNYPTGKFFAERKEISY